VEWVGERMGVTPRWPVEADRGVRACVQAAGKALEGDDRQILHQNVYSKIVCPTCTLHNSDLLKVPGS